MSLSPSQIVEAKRIARHCIEDLDMNHGHTPASLIAFTERVKAAFLDKQIHAPVHLNSSTQAEPLIGIFKSIRPQDYVFSTWRSAYHALLKGVPEEEVFQAILDGRSMYLMFRKRNFFSSAIVGGILPIALGVAAGIKRMNDDARATFANQNGCSAVLANDALVYVFIGDMCARTGLYHEFLQYSNGHSLPIRVIVEDNGLSTNASTRETWGTGEPLIHASYRYQRTEPHVGLHQKVSF